MGLLNKVRNYMLGTDITEDYEEYEDEYEEYDEEEQPQPHYSRERERERERNKEREKILFSGQRAKRTMDYSKEYSNVLNLPTAADDRAKVVICHPEAVDDATSAICDHLKNDVICVVNLHGVERANAQRIADFLSGACYALNGGIERISNDIFLVAPLNVGITSELREELKTGGYSLDWIASAFR